MQKTTFPKGNHYFLSEIRQGVKCSLFQLIDAKRVRKKRVSGAIYFLFRGDSSSDSDEDEDADEDSEESLPEESEELELEEAVRRRAGLEAFSRSERDLTFELRLKTSDRFNYKSRNSMFLF